MAGRGRPVAAAAGGPPRAYWPVLHALAALLLAPGAGAAQDAPLRIHPGTIELGVVGSLLSFGHAVDRSTIALRGARLGAAWGGLAGIETEIGHRHLPGLDTVELSGHVTWQNALGRSSSYPFAGFWGGLRFEKMGSFHQTRYPVGGSAGIRFLVSEGAAVRLEYRYARVIDREASDFNQHEVLTGVTLLLRNRP